eukprot:scaffold24096_cov64-Phaeocystis_antarctica.AAC.13
MMRLDHFPVALAGKDLETGSDSFYRSGSITLATTKSDHGPSVADQVGGKDGMAPFELAIRKSDTMYVLHTLAGSASADPYSRAWVRHIPIQRFRSTIAWI